MKDKEKQIEEMEMAREIYNALLYCHNNYNCHKCEFRHDTPFCKAEYIAKAISEHYQPKIPKDSVVLSREEYEKKKKHLQNVLELSSFQLENVVKENEKLKEQLKDKKLLTEENYNKLCHLAYFGYDDAYEKGCKETAEKFYDKVMSFIGSNQKFWIVDEEHITIIEVDKLFDFVMETAKQFGVEIKE